MSDRPAFLVLRDGKLYVNLAHVMTVDLASARPAIYVAAPEGRNIGGGTVGNVIMLSPEEVPLVAAALRFFDITPTRVSW